METSMKIDYKTNGSSTISIADSTTDDYSLMSSTSLELENRETSENQTKKRRSTVNKRLESDFNPNYLKFDASPTDSRSRYGRAQKNMNKSDDAISLINMDSSSASAEPNSSPVKYETSNTSFEPKLPLKSTDIIDKLFYENRKTALLSRSRLLSKYGSLPVMNGNQSAILLRHSSIGQNRDDSNNKVDDANSFNKSLNDIENTKQHANNKNRRKSFSVPSTNYLANMHDTFIQNTAINGLRITNNVSTYSIFKDEVLASTLGRNNSYALSSTFNVNEIFYSVVDEEWSEGDIAWGRVGKHPFWPCLICPDPATGSFVKLTAPAGRSAEPIKYFHVRFFADNGRRSELRSHCLFPYNGLEDFKKKAQEITPDLKKKNPKYCSAFNVTPSKLINWENAVEEANVVIKRPKIHRIDYFDNIYTEPLNNGDNLLNNSNKGKDKKVQGKKNESGSGVQSTNQLFNNLMEETKKHSQNDISKQQHKINTSLTDTPSVNRCNITISKQDCNLDAHYLVSDKKCVIESEENTTKGKSNVLMYNINRKRKRRELDLELDNQHKSKRMNFCSKSVLNQSDEEDKDLQVFNNISNDNEQNINCTAEQKNVVNAAQNELSQNMSIQNSASSNVQSSDKTSIKDKSSELLIKTQASSLVTRRKSVRFSLTDSKMNVESVKASSELVLNSNNCEQIMENDTHINRKSVTSSDELHNGIRTRKSTNMQFIKTLNTKSNLHHKLHNNETKNINTQITIDQFIQSDSNVDQNDINQDIKRNISSQKSRSSLKCIEVNDSLNNINTIENFDSSVKYNNCNKSHPTLRRSKGKTQADESITDILLEQKSLRKDNLKKTNIIDDEDKITNIQLQRRSLNKNNLKDCNAVVEAERVSNTNKSQQRSLGRNGLKDPENPVLSVSVEMKNSSSGSPGEISSKDIDKNALPNLKHKNLDDLKCRSDVSDTSDSVSEFDIKKESVRKMKATLFRGLCRERVCPICEKPGRLLKCRGPCCNYYHYECVFPFEDSSEIRYVDLDVFEKHAQSQMLEIMNTAVITDSCSSSSDNEIVDDEVGCKIIEYGHHKPFYREKATDLMCKANNFKCGDCSSNRKPNCFVCHNKERIVGDTTTSERHRCSIGQCGKFFHIECLKRFPQTIINSGSLLRNNKKTDVFVDTLNCPHHVCHTCVSDNPRGHKSRFLNDKLSKCIKCPTSYHSSIHCIPAGTQLLTSSQIICTKHLDIGKKSKAGLVHHVNVSWCFICAVGGSLICCETCPTAFHVECLGLSQPEGGYICEDCESGRYPLYDEVVWCKLGTYRWWPARVLPPYEVPDKIQDIKHEPGEFCVRFFGSFDHHWTNRRRVFLYHEGDTAHTKSNKKSLDGMFIKAVLEAGVAYAEFKKIKEMHAAKIENDLKPPYYIKIKTNRVVGSVKSAECDNSSVTPCECNPKAYEPCGPESRCLNRMLQIECSPTVCPAGDRCCNQAFEKRLYPPLTPYKTKGRGWGLKTLADIKAGEFVIEYVGDLIDDAEFKRRLHRKHEDKDENYYFLTLDKERMIDAGPKGNMARFMNHSCDPNCETQKWTVNGDIRVGLFALVNIPVDTELTFNYNLETIGGEKKKCYCGTPKCSGFIGAKVKSENNLKSFSKKNKVKKI